MDAQKIKFMLSIQKEIDKLVRTLGAIHPDVIAAKELFEKLSQDEITKSSLSPNDYIEELIPIKKNTVAIREHLEIRANNSIDYSFISDKTEEHKQVKIQLLKDNSRMENARLDSTLKNENLAPKSQTQAFAGSSFLGGRGISTFRESLNFPVFLSTSTSFTFTVSPTSSTPSIFSSLSHLISEI